MMSVKSILLTLAVLLAGFSSNGEVLYWMVEDTTAAQFPYVYASVKDLTSGGYLDYVTEDGEVWTGDNQILAAVFADGGVYGNLVGDVVHHGKDVFL